MISIFRKELGTVQIALVGAEDWTSWQIKIAETYVDPLMYFQHTLYVFEDCTFVIERAAHAVDQEGFKSEMKSIVESVRLCFPVLYESTHRLNMSPFPIGAQSTRALATPPDFLHESRLFRRGRRFEYERLRLESRPFLRWPDSDRYQAAAVFAALDHLVMKSSRYYKAGDLEQLRILYGLDVLLEMAENAGMFGSIGFLGDKGIGQLPRKVIESVDSISDSRLLEEYKDVIGMPLRDHISNMSSDELVGFIQMLIAERRDQTS